MGYRTATRVIGPPGGGGLREEGELDGEVGRASPPPRLFFSFISFLFPYVIHTFPLFSGFGKEIRLP